MKRILSLFIALLLVFSAPVFAQEEEIPVEDVELEEPTILPNSSLYGLKRAWERLGNMLTVRTEAKVQRALKLAERRLAEVKAMSEQGLDQYVGELSDEYEDNVEKANEMAKLSKEEKIRTRLARFISKTTAKHLEATARLEKRIAKTRAKIIQENLKALRVLAREDPEDAAELAMDTAEGLANEAQEDTDAEAIVGEYEEYANFGNEISVIAQQVGKNPERVVELVRTATAKHIAVLRRVKEKVPENAKARIQRAIERNEEKIEVHTRRLEEIKAQVMERSEENSETGETSRGREGQQDLTETPDGDLVVTQ